MNVKVRFTGDVIDFTEEKTYRETNMHAALTGLAGIIGELKDDQVYTKKQIEALFDKHLDPPVLKVRDAVVVALKANYKGEDIDAIARMGRYELAERIHKSSGPIEIPVEQATLIKELVGKYWGTTVLGVVSSKIISDGKK